MLLEQFTKKEPTTVISLTCYRLCVLASGSLVTDIFNCFTLIIVSCLHLGQKSGKFSSTVSSRTLTLVLLPQTGHNIHSYLRTLPPLRRFLLLCLIRSLFYGLVNFLISRFLIDVSISF
jgi:hypothetical protein